MNSYTKSNSNIVYIDFLQFCQCDDISFISSFNIISSMYPILIFYFNTRFIATRPNEETIFLMTDNPTSQQRFQEKYGRDKIIVFHEMQDTIGIYMYSCMLYVLIYIHTYPYLLLGIHTYPYLLKRTRTYPFISPINTCIFIYVIGNVSIFHDNDGVVGANYTNIRGTIIILFLFVFCSLHGVKMCCAYKKLRVQGFRHSFCFC